MSSTSTTKRGVLLFPLIFLVLTKLSSCDARLVLSSSSVVNHRDAIGNQFGLFDKITDSPFSAQKVSTSLSQACLIPRGGSLQTEDEDAHHASSLVVKKIRNLIRSLLEIGDRKSPAVSKLIRKTIGIVENIFGVKLLPAKKKKRSKKKSDVKSTASSEASSSKKKSKKEKKTPDLSTETLSKTSDEPEISSKSEKSKTKNKKSSPPSKKSKPSSSAASQAHLKRELKATSPNYRIQRELKAFLSSPPPNLRVSVGKNIRVWIITLTGAENTIYAGEKYRLKVTFPPNYPTVPPSMFFLHPTPRHEHVYTNGDICLSLLGKDWRPTMTAQSLAMSILSILSSAREKSLPMDNARHAVNKPGQPQDDWVYHDDNC